MAYLIPNNRGNLFKNVEKEQESSPDYSGELIVEGVSYFLDGWLRDSINGTFLSLRVKRRNKQPDYLKDTQQEGGFIPESTSLNTNFEESIPY